MGVTRACGYRSAVRTASTDARLPTDRPQAQAPNPLVGAVRVGCSCTQSGWNVWSDAVGPGAGPDVDHGVDGDHACEQEDLVLVLDSNFERVSVVPLHSRGQLAVRHDREVAAYDVATDGKGLTGNNADVEASENIAVAQSEDVGMAGATSPDLILGTVAEDRVLDPSLLDPARIVEAHLLAQADNRPVNSIRRLPSLILDHNVTREQRAASRMVYCMAMTSTIQRKTLNCGSATRRWRCVMCCAS